VAIVDRQMPEMDGLMLAAEIRKLRRDGGLLPLVMISSLGRGEAGVEGEAFAAFLLKPIRASQLYDALVGILAPEQTSEVLKTAGVSREFDPEMGKRLPLRILLAEDNPVNQKLALRLLQRLGYRADVAGNGLEAIEALRRQQYDVVLMDVQMPEMDGLEATRAIHREWPAAQRPRIIALTANVMKEDQEACFAAGMDDYLGKPIRVEELMAALSRSQAIQDR
jgi:CheY-like chemotaxis protein